MPAGGKGHPSGKGCKQASVCTILALSRQSAKTINVGLTAGAPSHVTNDASILCLCTLARRHGAGVDKRTFLLMAGGQNHFWVQGVIAYIAFCAQVLDMGFGTA